MEKFRQKTTIMEVIHVERHKTTLDITKWSTPTLVTELIQVVDNTI